jgi:signal transduction histidine kinase
MFDLVHFSLEDVVLCGGTCQRAAAPARSFEEAAESIVQMLYHDFSAEGDRAFVLVRLFATQAYGMLPPELRDFARRLVDGRPLSTDQKCLVLMASAGDRPEWNARQGSIGHQAIPLESDRLPTDFPMISQLLAQLGAIISAPNRQILLERSQRDYNVFYVQHALGSPHVVDQTGFVRPFCVRSAVGFGGALPSGEMFVVVAFSRVEIPPQVAELFRYLALNAKLALLPFDSGQYLGEEKLAPTPAAHDILASLSVQGATATDLLRTYVTIAADWFERSRVLAELSGELASVLHVDAVVEVFCRFISARVADGISVELEEGPVTRALRLGTTAVLSPLGEGTDPELLDCLAHAKCAVAIPLRTRGQLFGAVAKYWKAERAFEPMFIRFLEELVNRFAIALDNARLFVAIQSERQRAQEEASFSERLLAIVSHDLRNPLFAIRLASRSLAGSALDADQLWSAQQIVRSSERMMRLIGQLLDFSRLHRGMSLPMKFESAHLHAIAHRIVEEVRHGSPGTEIELDAAGRDDLTCDVVGVEQVLSNLLSNAIQHGAKGRITITIRDAGVEGIAIQVHNVGPPIPDEVRATMFEAFRQGEGPDARAKKGLGLGLYIAREIVRAHGGTIGVRSPDRTAPPSRCCCPDPRTRMGSRRISRHLTEARWSRYVGIPRGTKSRGALSPH